MMDGKEVEKEKKLNYQQLLCINFLVGYLMTMSASMMKRRLEKVGQLMEQKVTGISKYLEEARPIVHMTCPVIEPKPLRPKDGPCINIQI
jgi:hypothetical protein